MASTGQTGSAATRLAQCAFEHDRLIERLTANFIMRQQPYTTAALKTECMAAIDSVCRHYRKDCSCKLGGVHVWAELAKPNIATPEISIYQRVARNVVVGLHFIQPNLRRVGSARVARKPCAGTVLKQRALRIV